MTRAIIRYSIGGELSDETGNSCRSLLERAGFEKSGTTSDTYDTPEIPMGDALDAIESLVQVLRSPAARGTLDFLWIYLDLVGGGDHTLGEQVSE